jgi:hypothetical protein
MIPDDSVQVNLGMATARMALTNYAIPDYTSFANFAANGPSVPGTVSFDLRWTGVLQRVKDFNPAQGYAAHFIYDTAAIVWSGQQDGFTFMSDPASTSTSHFAAIGHERNGRFFHHGRGDEDDHDESE